MFVIVFLLYLLRKTLKLDLTIGSRFLPFLQRQLSLDTVALVHPPELGVNCWLLLLKASVTC